jgi:hypothetical protein
VLPIWEGRESPAHGEKRYAPVWIRKGLDASREVPIVRQLVHVTIWKGSATLCLEWLQGYGIFLHDNQNIPIRASGFKVFYAGNTCDDHLYYAANFVRCKLFCHRWPPSAPEFSEITIRTSKSYSVQRQKPWDIFGIALTMFSWHMPVWGHM